MSGEGTGLVSKFRIHSEATPGTKPSTGFYDLPFGPFELDAETKLVLSEILGPRAAIDAVYPSPISFSVPFQSELGYTILDNFMYGILGGKSTSGDGLLAGTAFANIFTPSTTTRYFSIELGLGDLPAGKVISLLQCLIKSVSIDFNASGVGKINVEIVPWKIGTSDVTTGDSAAGSAVTVVHQPLIAFRDATIYNIGVGSDTTYCVQGGQLKWSRDVAAEEPCLGSTVYRPPVYKTPVRFDYSLDYILSDQATLKSFLALLPLTGLDLKFVGGATGAGTDHYALEVKSGNHTVSKHQEKLIDNGYLKVHVDGTGAGNTGSGMSYLATAVKCTSNLDGSLM